MEQRALAFPGHTPSFRAADFIVTPSNEDAFRWIESWPNGWPSRIVLLHGPAGSGKSHLACGWAERSGASFVDAEEAVRPETWQGWDETTRCVVESIDCTAQNDALFHALNAMRHAGGWFLLTSTLPPAALGGTLPDLTSRLRALPAFPLHAPDDALLEAMLAKSFADRQLRVPKEATQFLIARVERSAAALEAWAARIDAYALATRRAVTLPLVREVLARTPDLVQESQP